MKKVFMSVLLVVVIGVIVFGLHNTNKNAVQAVESVSMAEEEAKADIVINDNFFIQSVNEVYLNIDNYVGKSLKIEGFIYEYNDRSGEKHVAVLRNTPGCCGNDGLAGLDILCDEYPAHGTWVEVVGTVKKTSIDGQITPIIEVVKLTQKAEGKSFVSN